jgi:hypothetical protein
MATLTEGKYAGEFLVSEPDHHISRGPDQVVTADAAAHLYPGHVMAQLATGKWVEYDDVGTDGSEEAAGVLNTEVDNSAGVGAVDFDAVIVQRLASIRKSGLTWKSGVSAGSKTNAYADLLARHIVAFD